jgi:SNF2 family DNA or RNA helicase
MAITLYKHQKDAIIQAVKKKKYGIYHEQGLGKTFSAIAVAYYALTKEGLDSVYVVCPAFLRDNWVGEINKFRP